MEIDWDDWRLWLRVGVPEHLNRLEELTSSLERFLSSEFNNVLEKAYAESAGKPQEQIDLISEQYEEIHWVISEVFPDTLWKSLFVSCYSFLEHTLSKLCRNYEKEIESDGKLQIGLSDLKDSGIQQAKTYLSKVIGIPFPANTQSWGRIQIYRRVRNFIVHNNGRLHDKQDNNSKTVSQFAEFCPSITIVNRRIVLSREFCSEFLVTLRHFVDELVVIIK